MGKSCFAAVLMIIYIYGWLALRFRESAEDLSDKSSANFWPSYVHGRIWWKKIWNAKLTRSTVPIGFLMGPHSLLEEMCIKCYWVYKEQNEYCRSSSINFLPPRYCYIRDCTMKVAPFDYFNL